MRILVPLSTLARGRWRFAFRFLDVSDCRALCCSVSKLGFFDFVHKELVKFSLYNVRRSIPSVIDGLKPGQRKVLFSCFKRKLVSEINVAQLAGYVAEHTAYHHGEVGPHSLLDASRA